MWRVDPATNGVTETVTLGETDGLDCLVFENGSLWVTVFDRELIATPDINESNRLLRVDPQTGDVISQFEPTGRAFFAGIAAGPGGIWIGASSPGVQGGACGALLAPTTTF